MIFNGFDDWVEIFRGGPQVDGQGRIHDGDRLIDSAVAKFSASHHEPPLVVGHPSDNAPAFGWVADLRRVIKGGVAVLEAKFKQVVPELVAAVRQGLFKKRSAAFYSDGALRHVGLLGAMPPAVKGLADIGFAQGEVSGFEFPVPNSAQSIQADQAKAGERQAEINHGEDEMEDSKQFTRPELEAALRAAEERVRAQIEAEFAERRTETARQNRRREIETELAARIKDGRIPPALVDLGLAGFIDQLDPLTVLTFGEGPPRSQVDFMFALLDRMDHLGLFREIATKERAGAARSAAEADQTLGRSIAAKLGSRPRIATV